MNFTHSYQLTINGQVQSICYTSLEALLLDPDNPVTLTRSQFQYKRQQGGGYPVDLGNGLVVQELTVVNTRDVRKKLESKTTNSH